MVWLYYALILNDLAEQSLFIELNLLFIITLS